MKVIGGNNIIGISDFKKNFSSKRLSSYRKLLILFPRWEGYFLEINGNRSLKTLTHVASIVTKHSERNKNNL
jgi:hypothetical protein